MRSLPDELFLSAGSVGGRSSDTQHLLYGLQHCTLAAAVGARHKVDVGTAGRGRNDMRNKYQAERHIETLAIAVTVYKLCRPKRTAATHVQGLKVRLGTMSTASVLHGVQQPAHSSCIEDDIGHAAAVK